MLTADYNFELPRELIAQAPAAQRDHSRLLVLNRNSGRMEHRMFLDLLQHLRKGDVLVLNDSRVIRARLHGHDAQTGREFEILLVEENATNDWWAMMRPARRAPLGTRIYLQNLHGGRSHVSLTINETNAEGHRRICFAGTPNVLETLQEHGEVPLPPYITRANKTQFASDSERYQTVFAKTAGSVAAPTAGLHFTEKLLEQIRSRGVVICFVTLHVGVGTFAPVKSELISDHQMHEERFEISDQTVRVINDAKRLGNRIIAVGTTTVRVLESLSNSKLDFELPTAAQCADTSGSLIGNRHIGRTSIFIYPPYQFKIVDALITNFHLPRSTLLMLVSAFAGARKLAGREMMLGAYTEAIREKYRFFSYGDAMLIL
jgi:S-adenosylmethionine:tRNA ribosyltransferase-isomerase